MTKYDQSKVLFVFQETAHASIRGGLFVPVSSQAAAAEDVAQFLVGNKGLLLMRGPDACLLLAH